jgi:hypothetical protein
MRAAAAKRKGFKRMMTGCGSEVAEQQTYLIPPAGGERADR